METDNPFEKVLDRLRERGWMKGDYWYYDNVHGPTCMLGAAIQTGVSSDLLEIKVPTIIQAQYPERFTRHGAVVPFFNDHPDTTLADVERVLEKAAVKWEEERVMRDE